MFSGINDYKILLVAVNSSYIHTNPAVRKLAQVADATWCEFNINQPLNDMLHAIYQRKPRIVAFSCYIWNIQYVLRLAQDLKKILPKVKVLLGGPEVSFDARALMERHACIDAVVCGEAEEVLQQVLQALETGDACGVEGALFRTKKDIIGTDKYIYVPNFSALGQETEEYDKNKIYYYESSRGCPFGCAYCLSGTDVPMREKPVTQVKKELAVFVDGGARLVKFTDRTFNANKTRAAEILNYVIWETGETAYHFEIALDLVDDAFLDALRNAPKDKVQLEAGVQTCNQRTLDAAVRKTNMTKLKNNAKRIMEMGTVHLHLDLIAGLPYEGMQSFEDSFNQIYALYPHYLQLGFLKLLKGSRLREEAGKYDIRYREYPPYEVLETADITAGELFLLKGMEEMVNRYYNTGRARRALDYLTKEEGIAPFGYYRSLNDYCIKMGYYKRPVSAADQFHILIWHAKECLAKVNQTQFLTLLKYDYMQTRIKGRMPKELEEIKIDADI
ncbi:B12-binding domain-containing radical SAM protein [Christensenellaceae bacterium OttesenSCG-928-K19]|nr:B12-binding domain-containing radical SAM protein [Christensenellaceae bacterium OttesenSCG-928-K19]